MPKGHKLCPKCKTDCVAISKECSNCKNKFISKAKPPKSLKVNTASVPVGDRNYKYESLRGMDNRNGRLFPIEYEEYRIFTTIYVPAGECPFKLKIEPDESDITAWAHKVRLHFLTKSREWLLNHGLCYYIKYGYERDNIEADRICEIINKLPDVKKESERSDHGI